jgi:MerR family transcriptional regulator, copper efflux regulator
MNISKFAQTAGVTTDTIRYYEKQGLLAAPERQSNGYRSYLPKQVQVLSFIRGAQALGFSLKEIRDVLPMLSKGAFKRADIEELLASKVHQIDAHILQLKTLKKELQTTLNSLQCEGEAPVSLAQITATDSGSGAGVASTRMKFSLPA